MTLLRPQHLIAVALAFAVLLYPVPARGQDSPAAQQLRVIADGVEFTDNHNRELADKVIRLEIENRRLSEAAVPFLEADTEIVAGGMYRLRDGPTRIDVTAPGVTLIGGKVHPEPHGAPAITARDGGEDLTVYGVVFDWPDAPDDGKKLPLQPCVRTSARGTRVIRCLTGHVNGFVEALPGADGTTIDGCHARRGLRSAMLYAGGADNTTVLRCTAVDSAVENLLRWSPHKGVVGRGAIVAWCTLGNPGNKSVIDFRHVTDALAMGNELFSDEWGTSIGVGRTDNPNAGNIRLIGNKIHGRVHIHQARGLVMEDNTVFMATQGVNNAIYLGTASDVRLRRNTGPMPAPGRVWDKKKQEWETVQPKALIGVSAAAADVNDDGSSAWTAPPATQPTTQPIE